VPDPGHDGQKIHDGFSVLASRLDEDREQADDDRQDAEALGEGGENDRDASDLAGSVRVATDRLGGHAREDADADAGAEHPKSGKTGADVLHSRLLLLPERTARDHFDRG
jgi:hypothetical protein